MTGTDHGDAAACGTMRLGALLPLHELTLVRDGAEPLYHQVYSQLRALIVDSGRLTAGTRLPSSRILAAGLGVSRNTVLLAYQRLQEDGYVRARAGGGTVVRGRPAVPAGRPPHRAGAVPGGGGVNAGQAGGRRVNGGRANGRMANGVRASAGHATGGRAPGGPAPGGRPFPLGVPPVDLFPTRLWSALHSRRLRLTGDRLLLGTDPLGHPPLRAAVAAFLGVTRGVVCGPEQVFITSGTTSAVQLACRALLEPGDRAWCEDPGPPRVRRVLDWCGARPVPVPVDGGGLDVAAAVRRAPDARLAVVGAAHQLPTGAALSAPRRAALLRHAREHGAPVVDVEYDGPFLAPGAAPPLWAEAGHGEVVHAGSFDSLLFPELHVGYCVVPAALADRFARAAGDLGEGVPAVTQAVLADFLDHHRFARLLESLTAACAERRAALLGALRELPGPGPRPSGAPVPRPGRLSPPAG